MTKQEAAAMLVQLYADYSTLCDKYGWPPSDGMSEAVAIAVKSTGFAQTELATPALCCMRLRGGRHGRWAISGS